MDPPPRGPDQFSRVLAPFSHAVHGIRWLAWLATLVLGTTYLLRGPVFGYESFGFGVVGS